MADLVEPAEADELDTEKRGNLTVADIHLDWDVPDGVVVGHNHTPPRYAVDPENERVIIRKTATDAQRRQARQESVLIYKYSNTAINSGEPGPSQKTTSVFDRDPDASMVVGEGQTVRPGNQVPIPDIGVRRAGKENFLLSVDGTNVDVSPDTPAEVKLEPREIRLPKMSNGAQEVYGHRQGEVITVPANPEYELHVVEPTLRAETFGTLDLYMEVSK